MTIEGQSRPFEAIHDFFNADSGLQRYLFVPFIRAPTLRLLLGDLRRRRGIIVTRWNCADLASGASDPEAFRVCEDLGLALMIHKNLHMKVFSWDLETALVGSANVTEQGLGLAEEPNLEFMSGRVELTTREQLYLRGVITSARLVTPEVYQTATGWLERRPKPPVVEGEENPAWYDQGPDPSMLVSSLPMTESPSTLRAGIAALREGRLASLPPETRLCTVHDIVNYELMGIPDSVFDRELRQRFFSHRFVQRILERINPCAYFGELKEWVQTSCQDVPVPSRRDLTGNVQVLLSWLVDLGDGEFVVDVPGAHSQRICHRRARTRTRDHETATGNRVD